MLTRETRKTLRETNFQFKGQTAFYKGKVRDVYTLRDELLVMVASDRISAFDVVLAEGIPFKGQVLNQTAVYFLEATRDLVPNWLLGSPDPNVSVGIMCEPFKVEMVIRGYLAGHAARVYAAGKRMICGVALPDGLRENDPLPEPIITPTTKADAGHDMDISREDIIKTGLVSPADYEKLEVYTRKLYARGTEMAAKQGLILVDTKYEFGKSSDGTIRLIDEIHTPDSSRYFYKEGYEERQQKGEAQLQLSKEFVRQWLISKGFQGQEGAVPPGIDDVFAKTVTGRYIELYQRVTGRDFQPRSYEDIENKIYSAVSSYIDTI